MKKFLLINSPIFYDATNEQEEYLSPLGLGYIATYLKRSGIEVELIDCLKRGISVSELIELIDSINPDCIGINIFTQNYDIVKCIVENISIHCECFVGGQVVKSIYNSTMLWDVENTLNIIIGEGEFIIPDIVLKKCTASPMLQYENKRVYKVDKESSYFPIDISNLYLDRQFLENEITINHYSVPEVAIVTSRGCLYDCAFCGGAKSLNEDVMSRVRSEDSVCREINEILSIYPNVKSIRILDDLFLRNSDSIDMATGIFKRFPDLSWRGMAHVLSLANAIDKIKDLRESNCKELFIGIESGSQRIRRKINKLGSRQQVVEVATEILSNGIDLKGYFIFGFPTETVDDFEDTYKLACELVEISRNTQGKFRTSVFQFRPYHGTRLYEEIVDELGETPTCKYNESISRFQGRSQFNFCSGNYSCESDELLYEYIIKTQGLMEEIT